MQSNDTNPLPLDLAQRIDALCLRFEKSWRAGEQPLLEEYLEKLPEAERPALFAELLRLEGEFRLGRGELATPPDLYSRFPGEQPRIDAIWREISQTLARPAPSAGSRSPTITTGPNPLQQLGDFRIIREIGQGGMGIVYEAEQGSLGRHVALKVLPRRMLLEANAKRRFEREARAAARLHHSNIVTVFGIGEHEGLPYYVMQFIQGRGLDRMLVELKRLKEGREQGEKDREENQDEPSVALSRFLPPSQFSSVAHIGIQVAEALAYAHQQGIVHRDIKPSNLLLDQRGVAWVTDFGLAKADDQQNLTQTGDLVGTLRYMPPEAFEGKFDARGDIYALGLTLYELLAFQPAFVDTDRAKLIKQVTLTEAPRLDTLNPKLPRDLVTIVHRCIDRDASRRYQTADEVAADLQRFLADEPIHARRISNAERLWRWSRHHRSLAASLAITTFLIVAVAIGSTLAAFWYQETAERNAQLANEKEQARQRAEQAGAGERWERYRANIAAAASALQVQNLHAARAALEAAPKELRNWEWRHFHCQLDTSRLVFEAPFALGTAVLSPDGKRAAATVALETDPRRPDVFVWETATGKQLHALDGGPGAVTSVISPDCSQAAFGTQGGLVRLVNLTTGQETTILKAHADRVTALEFSRDSKRLVSAGADRTIRLWNLTTAREVASLVGLDGAAKHLALSPNYKRLLVAAGTIGLWDLERLQPLPIPSVRAWWGYPIGFSSDGRRVLLGSEYPDNLIQVCDAVTGRLLIELRGHQNSIFDVASSPDGSRIASASQDQTVRLWDGTTGKQIAVLRGHTAWISAIAFSPDGKRLVSSGHDGTLRVWEAANGELIDVLRGHADRVLGVVWSKDGRQLASASADRTLRLWDQPSAAGRGVWTGHQNFVYDVACSPTEAQLASAAWDGTVRLWDLATGKETAALQHQNEMVTSVVYAPNGKQLVSVMRDDQVLLWDLATGKPRHIFKTPTGGGGQEVRAAFHPQGTRLAVGTPDGFVRLWNVQSGEPAGRFRVAAEKLHDLAFSPDGRNVACAIHDGTIAIWNVERQERVALLRGHSGRVTRVVYNKDGSRLASASDDRTARMWHPETGQELVPPLVHASNVWSVAFSPEGNRLATACSDNAVRLWDVATGQEVAELRGHKNYVKAVAFSPDGTQLFSGSGDFTVRVWDTLPADSAPGPLMGSRNADRKSWECRSGMNPSVQWNFNMTDRRQDAAPIPDQLRKWLSRAVQTGASDLHVIAGYPPVLRLHGELTEMSESPLSGEETHDLLSALCQPEVFHRLQSQKNVDFSFGLVINGRVSRFRANLFHTGRQLGACLRVVPATIPDFAWAGFPMDLAQRLALVRDGLVIVTGATGSGKTTTLAMIVNLLNQAGGYRIITVEEPVEYRFPRAANSVVTQREVGPDVLTFADGLKYGLRQDPDIILVGEIRDQETAQMALSAAETGHLVFTSLHTRDAKGAISRYADLFPQDAQRDVRSLLAMSLRAIVSQRLLPGLEKGSKRHLALEVLWNNYPIASAIRSGKVESIDNYLLTCREEGMLSFDESVRQLLKANKITRAVAEQNVRDVTLLNR